MKHKVQRTPEHTIEAESEFTPSDVHSYFISDEANKATDNVSQTIDDKTYGG